MGTETTQEAAPEAATQDEQDSQGTAYLDPSTPPPSPEKGTHYSPAEVATYLGVKTQTVYRWVNVDPPKIVPAVQAGDRIIAFSREQFDELRKLAIKGRMGGGGRGSKDAKPNPFSTALINWRMNHPDGPSRTVVGGWLAVDDDDKGMSEAQVGRWENGESLPTAEAATRIIKVAPELAAPYVEAKAEAASAAKARREAKKAEQAAADAPSPEQAAADSAA